jgi:uncharacterized protein YjbJ (UPF0337 family)
LVLFDLDRPGKPPKVLRFWQPRNDTRREACPVSKRDKARNTAQAAKGKTKQAAGKAAGNPYAQAKGGAEQKKANLKQAGEKLKDTAKK